MTLVSHSPVNYEEFRVAWSGEWKGAILTDTSEDADPVPGFLLLSVPGETARPALLDTLTRAVAAEGGVLLAVGPAADNAYLEIGTPPKSVIVATWPSQAAVIAAWPSIAGNIAGADADALVALAGPCMAEDGLPDFPTRAAAAPMQSPGPPAFMVVEGTVTAAEPMARYRDIIFPMISERGGYYLVYLPRAQVSVLHGDWPWEALIVSRWPDAAAAHDFWYCDRYQKIAIPTRAGSGVFSVILLPAA
jgi:uncharacterized protein (DUF1330 family)